MTLRLTLYSFLLLQFCTSCGNEDSQHERLREETTNIVVSVNTRSLTDYADRDGEAIDKMDIFCFVQKPGGEEYTYETTHHSVLTPSVGAQEIQLPLSGTLNRIFYFVTSLNDASEIWSGELIGITADQFAQGALITGSNASMDSTVLVAKQFYTPDEATKKIAADLANVAACLDVYNECVDLVVDSLVLGSIPNSVYAFNNNIPDMKREMITYGNVNKLYIYPTHNSTLTIHGKYKNVRMVLDVALSNIQKNTRYKVALLPSGSDSSSPVSRVIAKVSPWKDGGYNDATIDWK